MALPSNFLGDLLAATQGGTVEPAAAQNTFGRLISNLGNDPAQPIATRAMTAADAGSAPIAAPAGRPRRSVLDMIGGLADVIANVGGASPLYQQNLDANRAREIAEEDRQFQIDNRPLEQRLMQQKLTSGDQNIAMGDVELQNARNAQLEGVGAGLRQVFGAKGAAGLQNAWPLVAQQFGLDPQRAQEIGQALAADPEGTLSALFPQPLNERASKSKEVQIYELLSKEGTPEEALAYRKSLTNPDALTEKERATLELARERFNFEQYKYANPQETAGQRTASAKEDAAQAQRSQAIGGAMTFLDTLEETVTALNASGGMSNKSQSIGDTIGTAARESIPLVERLASPEGYAARERLDGLLTQGVFGLLPLLSGVTIGSKNMDAAKEMENLRKSIASAKSFEAAMAAIQQFRKNLQYQQRAAAPKAAPAARPQQRGAPPARQTRQVPNVSTAAEFNALPRGATFRDPDGNLRRKP